MFKKFSFPLSIILLTSSLITSCVAPVFLAGYILTSGVSTKIVSFRDPSYRNASFGRFLVIADYKKMEAVQKIESILVKRLNYTGVYATANSSLLPPIREYTDDEKKNALTAENLDCYIIISQIGVNTDTVYIPSVSTTETKVERSRNEVNKTSTTVTSPGSEMKVVKSIDTKAELYDFQNGKIVWKGEANTSHQYTTSILDTTDTDYIFDSFCSEIVEELQKNSLLK